MNKIAYILILITSLSACKSIKYVDYSKILNHKQITEDIEYLKHNLAKHHYDLNWENKQKEIMLKLDSLASLRNEISSLQFKNQLISIVNTIDDGHTRVFGIEENLKSKNRIYQDSFSCKALDEQTILLKIPNFINTIELVESIKSLQILSKNHNYKRLIIDIRGNRGGNVKNVRYFLENILTSNTSLCELIKLKKRTGLMGYIHNLSIRIKEGFKKIDSHLIKNCTKLNILDNPLFDKKYLIVDSTIASGGMVATYQLRKDGFRVLGSNPKSLFNSFGYGHSKRFIYLSNSKLYISVSSTRIILDENFNMRQNDMLKCDMIIDTNSITDILNKINKME